MTSKIKLSGAWKDINKIFIKVSGQWKAVQSGFIKVLGQWKLFFTGEDTPQIQQQVTITQSTDPSSALVTLTGTNYYWTNFTSLTYYFEWSTDGGSTWTIINTGSITNPVSGSSNTKTYLVQTTDTVPNIDNLYRFRVFAQNITLTNSSTSTSTTISTPRNVTNVSAARIGSTLQANVSFSVGLYTSSVKITRREYIGSTLISTATFDKTTASPSAITLPAYNRTYTFTVIPYSGSLQSSLGVAYVTGYPGNETAETTGLVIGPPPTPSQLTKPTLSPTGSVQIGTTLTASAGTYESGTYHSITTRVYGWAYPPPTLSDGSTTAPNNNSSSGASLSLTPSQGNVNYTYYAIDIVTSADQTSTYYYYSNLSATAFLPSFSDNFDRANTNGADGIGRTSTGSWFWSISGNIYGYQNPSSDMNDVSWEIDNNTAYNAYTVPFDASPTGYPMKTINVGDSNVSISTAVTNGGGGPGLAFWVTASGSWWAVAPSYYRTQSTVTTYPCSDGPYTHSSTTCPTTYPGSTTVGQICSCTAGSSTTTYNCTGGPVDALSCPAGPYSTTAANLGLRCSSCTTVTSTACTGSGICAGEGCCPTSGSADGQRCNSCTPYKICDVYEKVVLASGSPTLGTGCGDRCTCTGPYTTAGTSTCGSSTVNELSNPGAAVSCVTAADVGKPCQVTFIGSSWLVKRCTLVTASERYFDCTKNRCGSTYNTNETSTYQRYNTVASSTTTVNASYYKVTTGTETVTTYYSRIRILSANGSSVISQAEKNVASSNSSYQLIRGLAVTTSNNLITAKAYSDVALTAQMSTDLSHTASNPTKTVAGDSAVGIINTPTDENRITGNRLDNFVYTNV